MVNDWTVLRGRAVLHLRVQAFHDESREARQITNVIPHVYVWLFRMHSAGITTLQQSQSICGRKQLNTETTLVLTCLINDRFAFTHLSVLVQSLCLAIEIGSNFASSSIPVLSLSLSLSQSVISLVGFSSMNDCIFLFFSLRTLVLLYSYAWLSTPVSVLGLRDN